MARNQRRRRLPQVEAIFSSGLVYPGVNPAHPQFGWGHWQVRWSGGEGMGVVRPSRGGFVVWILVVAATVLELAVTVLETAVTALEVAATALEVAATALEVAATVFETVAMVLEMGATVKGTWEGQEAWPRLRLSLWSLW